MKNMTYRQMSAICRKSFGQALAELGFSEIERSCLFVRRAGEIVHTVAVNKSNYGAKCRVVIGFWVQEFSIGQSKSSRVEVFSRTWARTEKLNVYALGPEKWWSLATEQEAEASFSEMIGPFMRGAVPWFRKINTRKDLISMLVPEAPSEIRSLLEYPSELAVPVEIASLPIWNERDSALL